MQKRKGERLLQFPRKRSKPAPIDSLPEDLFVEVLASVASSSLIDLLNSRITSKYFLRAANNNYIFQHVSLQSFPRVSWKTSLETFSFLKNCRDNGNPEALYRQGMLEFFSYRKQASGLTNLKASAEKHPEASYVYGIILYLGSAGLHSKQEGLTFLKSCEAKGLRMKECRKRIKAFVWHMWINNFLVPEKENSSRQISCDCALKIYWIHRRRGWEYEDEDDEDVGNGEALLCESCKWDREASRFCNMLRSGSYG